MTQFTRNRYDLVPYLARSHTTTHPDRMAMIATLLDLEPAPVTRARVLELGCAGGGNLLPLADHLPASSFVGLDFSPRQIAAGRTAVAEMGLKNLELQLGSILDVDDSLGEFDYIISHGVFSWVAPEVQEKLLAICRRHLAPNGVAYISYNTLPGWYQKLSTRDLMQAHARHISDPHAQIRKSREILNLVADLIAPMKPEQPLSAHAAAVRGEAELVKQQEDDYIFHEYLEEVNTPIYVSEFVQRAERHGLQYLGDADRGLVALDALGEPVAAAMRQLTNGIVEQEQFLDYLSNRSFRCTLLVQGEAQVNRSIGSSQVRRLFVRAHLKPPENGANLHNADLETFETDDGSATVGIAQPVSKAALMELRAAWPRPLAFDELLARACQAVYAGSDLADNKVVRAREAEALGLNLLRAHLHNNELVHFHTYAPCLPEAVPALPVASRSARYEALLGANVTTAYHQTVRLNELAWNLLPFLDGTRDRAALVELVAGNNSLSLEHEGQVVKAPELKRELVAKAVDECLELLRQLAVLVEN